MTATLAGCGGNGGPDAGRDFPGYAYAATNGETANAIVRYGRDSEGVLTYLETTPTNGVGVGDRVVVADAVAPKAVDPLFSNDSLVLSRDGRLLFVVNAGSGSVSSFRVGARGAPALVATTVTGGQTPTGLALTQGLLYVSHAAAMGVGGPQLFGFRVADDGSLSAISGARYGSTGPTLITHALLSPDGDRLVVVELMTGTLRVFPVREDGTLGIPVDTASPVPGPFGAEFLDNSTLLVSEVHPGEMAAGSTSSYRISSTGTLTPISSGVPNGRDATCWLTKTPDGRYVYASNTTSSDVSLYGVDAEGALRLLDASAASLPAQGTTDFMGNPSSGPVDAFISGDGRFFYQQYSGLGVIAAYRIGGDGSLSPIPSGNGGNLPKSGSEGLAGN